MGKNNWFKKHPVLTIVYSVLGIFIGMIFLLAIATDTDYKSPNTESNQKSSSSSNLLNTNEEALEILIISCNGPAGENFPLFKEAESYDITSKKITCKNPVEILERTCVSDIDSYTLEMDKVRQGDLVGWAMRKDLKCESIYCDSAPDSICNERN